MEADTRSKKVTQTDNTVDLKRVTSSIYGSLGQTESISAKDLILDFFITHRIQALTMFHNDNLLLIPQKQHNLIIKAFLVVLFQKRISCLVQLSVGRKRTNTVKQWNTNNTESTRQPQQQTSSPLKTDGKLVHGGNAPTPRLVWHSSSVFHSHTGNRDLRVSVLCQ